MPFQSFLNQPKGSALTLTCNVFNAASRIHFVWLKNGQNIGNSSAIKPTRYSIDTKKAFSHFYLYDLESNDSANYSCIASTKYGSSIQTTVLSVTGTVWWILCWLFYRNVALVSQIWIVSVSVFYLWIGFNLSCTQIIIWSQTMLFSKVFLFFVIIAVTFATGKPCYESLCHSNLNYFRRSKDFTLSSGH